MPPYLRRSTSLLPVGAAVRPPLPEDRRRSLLVLLRPMRKPMQSRFSVGIVTSFHHPSKIGAFRRGGPMRKAGESFTSVLASLLVAILAGWYLASAPARNRGAQFALSLVVVLGLLIFSILVGKRLRPPGEARISTYRFILAACAMILLVGACYLWADRFPAAADYAPVAVVVGGLAIAAKRWISSGTR